MCVWGVLSRPHSVNNPINWLTKQPRATITSILALEAVTFELEIYVACCKSKVRLWWPSGSRGSEVSPPVCQTPTLHPAGNPIQTTQTNTHTQQQKLMPAVLAGEVWGCLSAVLRPSHLTRTSQPAHALHTHTLMPCNAKTLNAIYTCGSHQCTRTQANLPHRKKNKQTKMGWYYSMLTKCTLIL